MSDIEKLADRSEEHTSELQSLRHPVCRLLLEKKKNEIRDARPIYTSCCSPSALNRAPPPRPPRRSAVPAVNTHQNHRRFVTLFFFFFILRRPPDSYLFPPSPFFRI